MTFNFTRYYIAFSSAILVLASFFYISIGSIPNAFYGHDAVLLFDEAWRMQNGQIPHHDFYLNVGSGYSYLCAFFLRLNHYDAIAFSWMNVVVTAICFLSIAVLLRTKNNSACDLRGILNILLILLFIIALGFGCYSLGAASFVTTYGMLYNRYCYALLTVIFTACFLTRQTSAMLCGFINGLCLFALLITKIPFFALGLFWIGLSFLQNRNAYSLLTSIILCSVLLIAYFLLTSIHPAEMFADYTFPASLRIGNVLFTSANLEKKFSWIPYLPTVAIASMGIAALYLYEKQYLQAVLALSIIGGEFLLHLINFGVSDIPLLVLLTAQVWNQLPGRTIVAYIAVAAITLHSGYFIYKNIEGFEEARTLAQHKKDITPLNEGHIRNLYIIREAGLESRNDYTGELMEGADLIRNNIKMPQRIETLGPVNAFNTLLDSPPPRYMPVVWQFNYTFNNEHFPEYSKTFSDTEILMVPRQIDQDSTTSLEKIYGNDIMKDFKETASSSRWILLQRKH